MDLVTRTAEGIKNTTTLMDEDRKVRIRPPRYFGSDKVLHVYNFEKSLGQEIMASASDGVYINQSYVYHVILPSKDVLVLTEQLVLYLTRQILDIGGTWQTEWKVRIRGTLPQLFQHEGRGI